MIRSFGSACVRTLTLVSALLAATASWSVEIWATDNLGQFNAATVGDRIIKFDSANPAGTVVVVGATGALNEGLSGLDFGPDGTLYAVSGFHAAGGAFPGSNLYTINKTTGAATLVGFLGLPAGTDARDLSWNPVLGVMQVLAGGASGSNSMYTVNLSTGAATLVGSLTGLPSALTIGLATDSAGVNYVHDLVADQMYTLNGLAATPTTMPLGIATNFSQGMTIYWGLTNDWFLGAIWGASPYTADVRLLDRTTGTFTSVLGTWPNSGGSGFPQYETGDIAVYPKHLVVPATLAVSPGFILAGNVASLASDDANELRVRPGPVLVATNPPISIVVTATAPCTTSSAMSIDIERRATIANAVEKIELTNYVTNVYDLVATNVTPTANSVLTVPIANPGNYINGTGAVRARITYKPSGAVLVYPWSIFIDRINWRISP